MLWLSRSGEARSEDDAKTMRLRSRAVQATFCALLLVANRVHAGQQSYEEIFGAHYREALRLVREQGALLCETIASRGGDADVLIPVVFPEILRYSLVRDRIETTGLKVFYVHVGEASGRLGDFSIGLFQMKPTFVEKLEGAVVSFDLLDRFRDVVEYPRGSSEKAIRQARVDRLESAEWQAVYLACFGAVMNLRFGHMAWERVEDKIGFYAAAYNHGFLVDAQEISRWEKAELFPYGMERDGEQYSYTDIARTFALKYWIVTRNGTPRQGASESKPRGGDGDE
jgi:hypothetical protein